MSAPAESPPKNRIRDAASVILVRRDGPEARLLMGQRGQGAAFMPSKFVFPGGAVDPEDAAIPHGAAIPARLVRMLAHGAAPGIGRALVMAAIRELWEETGLALAHPAVQAPAEPPESWREFFAAGHAPAPDRLDLIFRAVTPPGRPRRFDARFFMVEAEALASDPDDLSRASGELGHLHWVALGQARALDLPFITEVVLGEVAERLARPETPRAAPFFHHSGGRSFIDALG